MRLRPRTLDRYIALELVGPLVLGLMVFTFLLMIDALFDLAEILIHRDVPAMLVIAIGVVSAVVLSKNADAGNDPLKVRVFAQQFAWRFIYEGDVRSDQLVMPVDRAVEFGADIILCAFGGYSTDDVAPAAIETAVANVPKSTVVIAAAGNERQDKRPIWPASCRGVEAIAALDSTSDGSMKIVQGEAKLAWYTNFGPDVVYAAGGTWQSSFVTGEESPDRDPDGSPETFVDAATAGGTSFSAAAVAGAVAAAMGEGDTGVEAWDRVREHTYAVDCSELRAIDVWNRPER